MAGVLRGSCGDCGHVWVVAYLPMELTKVVRIAGRAACPMCAGSQVFVATASAPVAPENPEKGMTDHG